MDTSSLRTLPGPSRLVVHGREPSLPGYSDAISAVVENDDLLLVIFSSLSLYDRMRLTRVSKRWEELLFRHSTHLEHITFDSFPPYAPVSSVDVAQLIQLSARHARGRDRSLDVTDPACHRLTCGHVLSALQACGPSASGISSLRLWEPDLEDNCFPKGLGTRPGMRGSLEFSKCLTPEQAGVLQRLCPIASVSCSVKTKPARHAMTELATLPRTWRVSAVTEAQGNRFYPMTGVGIAAEAAAAAAGDAQGAGPPATSDIPALTSLDLCRGTVEQDIAVVVQDLGPVGLEMLLRLESLTLSGTARCSYAAERQVAAAVAARGLGSSSLRAFRQIDLKDSFAADFSGGEAVHALLRAASPTLAVLDLRGATFTPHCGTRLAGALASPTCALTHLTLAAASAKVDLQGVSDLAAAVAANTTLLSLELHKMVPDDASAGALASALGTNSTLTRLSVRVGMAWESCGDAGWVALASALATNLALVSLEVPFPPRAALPGFLSALAAALRVNSTLTTLDLGGEGCPKEYDDGAAPWGPQPVDDDVVAPWALFAAAVAASRALEALRVRSRRWRPCAATFFAAVDAAGPDARLRLRALDLGATLCDNVRYGPQDDAVSGGGEPSATAPTSAHLGAWLASPAAARLTALNLNAEPLGDSGAQQVASALAAGRVGALTALHLEACGIGESGAQALALALLAGASPVRLVLLSLSHNPVGDDGAAALAEAISGGTRLATLWLADCSIRESGAKDLAAAVTAPAALLQELKLGLNVIGDGGASALAATVGRRECSLYSLDLSFASFGDVGALAFARAISSPSFHRRSRLAHLFLRSRGEWPRISWGARMQLGRAQAARAAADIAAGRSPRNVVVCENESRLF